MGEIKFEAVQTGDGGNNNGIMKIVRSGSVILLEKGKDAQKADLANGLVTEGVYTSSAPNRYNPDKTDYSIREADGTMTILNGTASLARQFAAVNLGELVRVLYNGKKTIKRKQGGNAEMHDFRVLRAITADDSAE